MGWTFGLQVFGNNRKKKCADAFEMTCCPIYKFVCANSEGSAYVLSVI